MKKEKLAGLFTLLDKPWIPTNLPGCVLWLRADLGVTKQAGGDLVSLWADLTGSGHDFSAALGKRPLWQANQKNGKPAILFDGVNTVMTATMTVAQPFTLFWVYDHVTLGAFLVNDLVLWSTNLVGYLAYADAPIGVYWYAGIADSLKKNNANFAGFNIWSQNISGATSRQWLNGALHMGPADPGPDSLGVNTVYLAGLDAVPSRPTNINVAEMIIYAPALSDIDRQIVEYYLSRRYAI